MSLKNSASGLEVYDPTKSASALLAETGAKAIDISVPDYPVILRIATNGANQSSLTQEQKQGTSSTYNKSQSPSVQFSSSAAPSNQSTSTGSENLVEAEDETSSQSESVDN